MEGSTEPTSPKQLPHRPTTDSQPVESEWEEEHLDSPPTDADLERMAIEQEAWQIRTALRRLAAGTTDPSSERLSESDPPQEP